MVSPATTAPHLSEACATPTLLRHAIVARNYSVYHVASHLEPHSPLINRVLTSNLPPLSVFLTRMLPVSLVSLSFGNLLSWSTELQLSMQQFPSSKHSSTGNAGPSPFELAGNSILRMRLPLRYRRFRAGRELRWLTSSHSLILLPSRSSS